ncbi:GntR family transcriptional regulator [Roseibium polysiphoniae]|uniref:GntR family transcriptional regulator n=1 Tax=Roseibium polysiphoniae TaxID=2571221 RepID=A0A944GRA4_9HYPH|nr:GntR family transcriptional regulator [Roseibium polysiphoniae]MBS8259568.1 GntR family transcriptional regulator [Roseibium polysiphoniae]
MNRSEQICAALRTAILERALLPGMKLPEDALGERFGASRTIVRQALERLAAEGLVELRRNRGAVVATPSLEEARDLFDLRCQIEDLVVSRLIANFGPKHLEALESHLAKEIQAESGPEPVSIRLATEFHILMAQLTESPVLIRYVEDVGYRCGLTLALYSRPHSTDCGIHEHREIIEALKKGDQIRARDLMRHHLGAVADRALLKEETAGQGTIYLDALEPYAKAVRESG